MKFCRYRWHRSAGLHYCRYGAGHYRKHRCDGGCCAAPHRSPRPLPTLARTAIIVVVVIVISILTLSGQDLYNMLAETMLLLRRR